MTKERAKIKDYLFFQEGPGVRNTQYTSSGVKLLNVANLVDGKIDLSTSERYISKEEAYNKYKHFLVDEGDLIVASSGIKVEYMDKKMGFIEKKHLPLCMNTSTIRFKSLDEAKLDIKYFMYFLKSNDFKAQLNKYITGSAQLNYGPSHLKQMTFCLISKDKQMRVVNILSKIDKIIELYESQLKHFDSLVKSRFVEMFGDPVDNEKKWEKKRIENAVTDDCSISYGIVQTGDDEENGVPVFRPIDIVNHIPKISELKRTKKEISDKYKKTILKGNEILITVRANIGDVYAINEEFKNCNVGRGITPLRFDEKYYNKTFICEQLKNNEMNALIKSYSKGATLIQLNMEDLRKIEIIVPPIELQNDFASFVAQVDKSKFVAFKLYVC